MHLLPARLGDRFLVSANTLLRGACDLEAAELVAREPLQLPLHPALSDADLADIVAAAQKAARAYRR